LLAEPHGVCDQLSEKALQPYRAISGRTRIWAVVPGIPANKGNGANTLTCESNANPLMRLNARSPHHVNAYALCVCRLRRFQRRY
jgi:hypothetical protein